MKNIKYLALVLILYSGASNASNITHDNVMPMVTKSAKEFGERRANIFQPDSKISDAIGEGFVIPEDLREMPGEKIFIAGCRRHSCIEKAAAVVDKKNAKVIAFAIRNFECSYVLATGERNIPTGKSKSPVTCDREPLLSVYVLRTKKLATRPESEVEAVNNLSEWGKKVGAERKTLYIVENNE